MGGGGVGACLAELGTMGGVACTTSDCTQGCPSFKVYYVEQGGMRGVW